MVCLLLDVFYGIEFWRSEGEVDAAKVDIATVDTVKDDGGCSTLSNNQTS
jgi:hypothetical protein